MAMLLPSITTRKPEWVFYMPLMVRVKTHGLLSITLTQTRSWSVLRAAGFDTVFHHEALVLPLLLLAWRRIHQCNPGDGDIPFQNTRR